MTTLIRPGEAVELPSGRRGVVKSEPLRMVRWDDGSYSYPQEKHLAPLVLCDFCAGVGTISVTCPMCHGEKKGRDYHL